MRRSIHLSELTFLLDENISHKTYKRLRNENFQVKSTKSEKLAGTKNGDLLQVCFKNNWILITHDQDFLSRKFEVFHGIIVVKIHPTTDSVAGPILLNFLKTIKDEKIKNQIIILEKDGWKYKKE